jgi:hypothetical protein
MRNLCRDALQYEPFAIYATTGRSLRTVTIRWFMNRVPCDVPAWNERDFVHVPCTQMLSPLPPALPNLYEVTFATNATIATKKGTPCMKGNRHKWGAFLPF